MKELIKIKGSFGICDKNNYHMIEFDIDIVFMFNLGYNYFCDDFYIKMIELLSI